MVKKKAWNFLLRLGAVQEECSNLSVTTQLKLAAISKTTYYYTKKSESQENLIYMELIDREYVRCPFFGSHQMTASLRRRGYPANRKRVMKLMQKMGIEAIYSKLNLSKAAHAHKKYPYLLKGKLITESDEVWATDITYIPLRNGYLYLVVIMD